MRSTGNKWCRITIEKGGIAVKWGCDNWHAVLDDFKGTFTSALFDSQDKKWRVATVHKASVIAWARITFGEPAVTVVGTVSGDSKSGENRAGSSWSWDDFMGAGGFKFSEERSRAWGKDYRGGPTGSDQKRQQQQSSYGTASSSGRDIMHYEVLCVTPAAPWPVIKAAYKAMSLLNHPDQGGNEEAMKKINASFDALKAIHGKAG